MEDGVRYLKLKMEHEMITKQLELFKDIHQKDLITIKKKQKEINHLRSIINSSNENKWMHKNNFS